MFTGGMPTRRDTTEAPVVSDELVAPVGNEVELCYQTFGDPADEPLLLVMGLGGPMTWWDTELCVMLADAGFYVVRYDNRDTGRSTRIRARVKREPAGAGVRRPQGEGAVLHVRPRRRRRRADGPPRPRVRARRRHLDGRHDRADRRHRAPEAGAVADQHHVDDRQALRGLAGPAPASRRSSRRASPAASPTSTTSVAFWDVIGSPGYPADRDRLTVRAGETFDRGYSASGVMRQMMAILQQPDRTHRLRSLRVPALVVHGMADKMVHVSGGRSTAAAIPGAELRADRRDGPRPAARPLRDPRRGDRADRRPGFVSPG